MAEPIQRFTFTIIESPINQITECNFFDNLPINPPNISQQGHEKINAIRRKLQLSSKNSQQIQKCYSQKVDIGKVHKNYQINRNLEEAKLNVSLSNEHQTPVNNSINSKEWNEVKENNENSMLNLYKQLHFNEEGTNSPSNILKPSKNDTLNIFLQQIGEFKKSIHQIREKLQQNITNSKQQYKNCSEKKAQKRNKYQYSHQNYEYTNYKDLSNRGKSNRSVNRWKSHEKGYAFLSDHIAIQQFVIDASDFQPVNASQ